MTFVEAPFWARSAWRSGAPHVAVRFVTPVTPPVEPITVAEAKLFLRVTVADEEPLIARYITAARVFAEHWIHRPIALQDCDVTYDAVAASQWITLPFSPVASLTSIKVIDTAGVETTVDPSVYLFDDASEPARVGLQPGQAWPQGLRAFQAMTLRLSMGYASVPEDLVQALRLLVGHYFENRMASAVNVRFDATLPFGVAELLQPYELVSIA